MATTVNRALSGLIYIGYIVAAYFKGAGILALEIAAFFLLPLACIWFSRAMGGFTGVVGFSQLITESTPAFFMCAVGWFLLIGVPVIIYFIATGS